MLADMRLQYNLYHDIISSYHSDYKIYEGHTDNVPTLTKTIKLCNIPCTVPCNKPMKKLRKIKHEE